MITYKNLFRLIPFATLGFLSNKADAQWHDAIGNIDDAVARSAYFNDLCFLNPEYGFAVGNGSTILKFDGMDWRKQPVPENAAPTFFSISMTPDTSGWIVGEGATFYRYNKQNNTWKYFMDVEIDKKDFDKKNKPTIDVRSVYTLAENKAWAVSSGDNIFCFNGKKWTRTNCPNVSDQLYSVTFINDIGWAVGENGTIIKFEEYKWKKVESPTTNKLRSVHFESAELGFAAGDNGTLLKYENGKWSQVNFNFTLPENIKLRSVYALSDKQAWVVGDKGIVLCYNGKEWNMCKEKTSNGILTKIWFTTAGTGWACGQNSFLNFEAAAIDDEMNNRAASEQKDPPVHQASLVK
ncbi:MAG: WD40/YVTN/BNR-like repeat-containing protein [Bacteroidia bacterium]